MKYLCLGYHNVATWNAMDYRQRKALMEECLAYEDVLKRNGHYIDGKALRGCWAATTLRFENGDVSVSAEPMAGMKERLGGILLVSATDLNHAIQLMSRMPYVRLGGFLEIRPIDEEISS